ncbi:MAG: hypothetical protein ACR2NB_08665 [Solirubrobacteraceae bacterium]
MTTAADPERERSARGVGGRRSTASVRIREIRDGDEGAITQLLDGLDSTSRYLRWFTGGADVRKAADWAAHPERASAVGLLASPATSPTATAC